jgi:poly-D-alanine transfer protein DltD
MKKNELQELKIKYNKLSEDNKINKMLLAKILNIDLEKEFTKEELINKLEYCELNETEKKTSERNSRNNDFKIKFGRKKIKNKYATSRKGNFNQKH